MKKERILLTELWVGDRKQKIDNIFRYIQENAACLSLLFTATIAIGSAAIKFLYYLIDYGQALYFQIPKTMIDVSRDNLFYGFLVDGVIALSLILLNLIPYFLWCSQKKTSSKVWWSIFILMIPDIFLLIGLIVDLFNGIRYSAIYLITAFVTGIVFSSLFFFLGFYYGIKKHRSKRKELSQKDESKKDNKKLTLSQKIMSVCLGLVLLFVLESGVCIFAGYSNANSKNNFKIITSVRDEKAITYAVLYETSSTYVTTECKLNDGTISFVDLDVKYEIERDGVESKIVNATQK